MASLSNQDRVVEGNKFGVACGAKLGCERGGVGTDISARVDAALALMDMANHRYRLHKAKLCREDSGVYQLNDRIPYNEEGSGKLQKKKRKASTLVQSESMDHNVGKEGNLHETSQMSEGHKLIIKLPKKQLQHVEAPFRNDFDRLSTPSLGCDQRAERKKKKKKRTDVQNACRLVESDYGSFKSGRLLNEPPISSFKKKRLKGGKTDADFSDDEVPDTRPSKKLRLNSASTSVYEEFSFSIVHFLSAVRKAIITAQEVDDANEEAEEMNLPSLTVHEIVERVRTDPVDPAILEAQEPLEDLIRGALSIFSSKVAPGGAKGWEPLASYIKSRKGWSWIGPVFFVDEAIKEQVSAKAWGIPRTILVKLVKCFAEWLRSVQEALKQIASLPAPPSNLMQNVVSLEERVKDVKQRKCVATISPCCEELRAYFRKEEAIRYSMPERAFAYTTVDGRKSMVAPLKTCGRSASRMHDHFLLKVDRPPHVSILCLVRDAAARLPESMGTRTDICILMRDSQYIKEDVSDKEVEKVVSRGLDRLHYELDPCIRFNGETRLWVYLHGEKDEEGFEYDATEDAKTINGSV